MKIIKGTITTVAMIANLLFACMLIVASYASWVPPTLFRVPALFGLVFPIVLFCNLFFLFFWAFYRWRYIWVQLFTFLICAPAIWRYMPLNFTDENDTGAPGFTLVSYNAYNFLDQGRRVYDRNRTVQYILESGADVVCLQEASDIPAKGMDRLKVSSEQAVRLRQLYPYRLTYGIRLAVYSKYPIRIVWKKSFSASSDACAYRLTVDGHPLTIVNCHLESIGLTTTDKELYLNMMDSPQKGMLNDVKQNIVSKLSQAFYARAKQAQAIADFVEKQEGDVIVCGDFNDTPQSYAYRKIKDGMTDAFVKRGTGPGITYNANRFWVRIDHVFYRGGLEAETARIRRLRSSDHYPVWVRFKWKEQQQVTHK